jgi:hypothetical protein
MRKEILKELLKGSKPYSTNHQFAPILEQMFWDGEVEFKGNLVSITPLGEQRLKEM